MGEISPIHYNVVVAVASSDMDPRLAAAAHRTGSMLFRWRRCFAWGTAGLGGKKLYEPSSAYPFGALLNSRDPEQIEIELPFEPSGRNDLEHKSYQFDNQTGELRFVEPATATTPEAQLYVSPDGPHLLHERIARIIFDHYNIERAALTAGPADTM